MNRKGFPFRLSWLSYAQQTFLNDALNESNYLRMNSFSVVCLQINEAAQY